MTTDLTRSILANLFTPSYRVVGKAMISHQGLLALLNNPNTAYLQVIEASLARIHEPKLLTGRFRTVHLVKAGVELVALARREDMGSFTAARGGYGIVSSHSMRVITGSYEIEGHLEWAGRLELESIFSTGSEFFPLFNARIRAIQFPELSLETPAILLNRKKVDIIGLL